MMDKNRLISADDFFREFPELDAEPYTNFPTACYEDIYKDGYHAGFYAVHGQPEPKIDKNQSEKNIMLNKLSELPDNVLATAYVYATNYAIYGCNVTKQWDTALENQESLSRAYDRGYYDGKTSRSVSKWELVGKDLLECPICGEQVTRISNFCPNCGTQMDNSDNSIGNV